MSVDPSIWRKNFRWWMLPFLPAAAPLVATVAVCCVAGYILLAFFDTVAWLATGQTDSDA